MTSCSYKTIIFSLFIFVSHKSYASEHFNYFLNLIGFPSYSTIQIDKDLTLTSHKENSLSIVRNDGNLQRNFEFTNNHVFIEGKLKIHGKEMVSFKNFPIEYPIAFLYKDETNDLGIFEFYRIYDSFIEDRNLVEGSRYLALVNTQKYKEMYHYSYERQTYEMKANDLLIEIHSPKKITFKGKNYEFDTNRNELLISTGRGSEYFPAD